MFFGIRFADRLGLRTDGDAIVLPLLATQILWIHLVTDGAPALALGIDPPGAVPMGRPPRPPDERVITPRMWRGMLLVGVVTAAGTLLLLDAALPGGVVEGNGGLRYGQAMAFPTLMLFQLFNVSNARSDERSAFARLLRSRCLWSAVGLSLALQAAVIYVPFL